MKPLLKWTGGKRWLLPILKGLWEPHQDFKLVEPFTGGMAVALGLMPKLAILNDANHHLINFYQQVSNGLEINYKFKNNSDYYYKMREKFNNMIRQGKAKNKDAARIFYYLIKTGFNGLCRFNNAGEFNVPFGQHLKINYRSDFIEYKDVLKNWQLKTVDFENLNLFGNEFLYADPPYDVEFTKYTSQNFNWNDQIRLANWLTLHAGPVVASNQATERIVKLYQDLKFEVFILKAPRSISCNGDRRPALEIVALKGFKKSFIKGMRARLREYA